MDALSNGSGRKVVVEDAADHSVRSVAGRDLSPNRSHLFTIGRVHRVDVSNTLSEVELRVSSGVHSIDLNQSLVGVLEHLRSKLNQIKESLTFCIPRKLP